MRFRASFASVSRGLIEKFSKWMRQIEELARREYTVLSAKARSLVKATGMDFGDAFAQVKHDLCATSRKKKSEIRVSAQELRLLAPQIGHTSSGRSPAPPPT